MQILPLAPHDGSISTEFVLAHDGQNHETCEMLILKIIHCSIAFINSLQKPFGVQDFKSENLPLAK